jgi:hypothetical protein
MHEQQTSVSQEDNTIEQADEYNVRQILNGYTRSSSFQQNYTRLVHSPSQTGIIDEYGDQQQVLYEHSPNHSTSAVYETQDGSIITEEMLLRTHASNGGRFPTHLLTRLGSQVYDMPSEQVDLANDGRRVTTTTTTRRYYTINPGETGYESAIDETTPPQDAGEKYVQIKASDLKDVLANYDVFTNTGEKLEGEQLNF